MNREDELFFARHDIFVRQAREACQQSLYFLGMLYQTNHKKATEAVNDYRPFALHQVKGLIRGVYVPTACRQQAAALAEMSDGPIKDKTAAAVKLCQRWQHLGEFLKDNPALPIEDIPALRQEIIEVLMESRTGSTWKLVIHSHIPNYIAYLRKNLTFLWAIVLFFFVFRVEAINGLLRNEGWWILLPLFLLLVPIIVNRALTATLFRKEPAKVPVWDIGGYALRSIRELAVEPGHLVQRWPAEAPILRHIIWGELARLGAYLLWWIAVLLVLQIKGGSTVTVYAFLWIGFVLLIAANIIDLWDFISKSPVRFLIILAAFIATIFLLAGYGRVIFIVYFFAGAGIAAYAYKKLLAQNRKRTIYLIVSVIFLVAAIVTIMGHFTHARQVWTSRQAPGEKLERLAGGSWPLGSEYGPPVVVMIASGGGSRAAVFAGLTLEHLNADDDIRVVAQNLQAISSISGGSLANAAYIARLLSVADNLGQDTYESHRLKALTDLSLALSGDFLLPTLKGAVVPFQTRGRSIEEAWRKGEVALADYRLSDLVTAWQKALAQNSPIPPFPLPLFNTASLEGHDVVISPLAVNFYTQVQIHKHADSPQNYYEGVRKQAVSNDDPPTWVFYRDGIYGLENLIKSYNPYLASAVRASANFPFGFPLVEIEPQGKLYFSPVSKQKIVSLTDGGALSNSGMWSIYHLLMNNWEKLSKRGVMLLIVDAGKMAVYRNLQKQINSLVGAIQDQSTIGQNLHRRMYDLLKQQYGQRLAIVKFDLIELESYNVMTTWALDQDSLDILADSFKIRWPDQKKEILTKWKYLNGQSSKLADPLINPRRPPLD